MKLRKKKVKPPVPQTPTEAPLAPAPVETRTTPEPEVLFAPWAEFFGLKRDGTEYTPAEKAERALKEKLEREARDAEPIVDRTPFYRRSYTRDL